MALNEIGGLARGLAEGLQMGSQMRNQQELVELRKKESERDAEIHELQKDQFSSEKEIRDRRNAALRDIADYHKQMMGEGAPAQAPGTQPMAQSPVNLAGTVPQGGLAMNSPDGALSGGAPGLAPSSPQVQQPAQEIPPAKILERGMVTGMYSPKALTDIANIWAKHGLQDEGIKYMNQAYETEKRGGVRAAMAMMQNNPGSAADALKQGGVELEGMPVKVKPNDPNDMNWKINIKGQGEKTINVRDWLRATMDPEEFFKAEDRRIKDERDAAMDERKQLFVEQKGRAELGLETRKTDAQIGFLNDRGTLARARANNPGSLKASRSSDKSIEQAISRRDKRFDLKATVTDEDGKDRIDPALRGAYDDTAAHLQSIIEDETGEELDHRQHHKLTDEILRFPIDGTPQEKAKATAALLRRFKLDMDVPEEPATKGEPKAALSGKAPGKTAPPPAGALKPKKEPTREEQELKALESNRDYPTLITELKKLQKERHAVNLNEKDKAEVEARIKAILDSDRPKGSLK